ncbi:hypothetical protein GCM10009547_49350 [Sporichthya brevicatena]|uniref:Uncharacterized protein n=1 Tax=Sporichthya brevicatena TaxID=171442 RepID=A0ABN1HDD2_9ACTN
MAGAVEQDARGAAASAAGRGARAAVGAAVAAGRTGLHAVGVRAVATDPDVELVAGADREGRGDHAARPARCGGDVRTQDAAGTAGRTVRGDAHVAHAGRDAQEVVSG